MEGPFLRSAYNYDMDSASIESGLECLDPSLTQQQFLEETEMRNIVERFGLTGTLPENVHAPQFGDFTEVNDFQSAMNAVRSANERFMLFPAHVRARFHNDPQELLLFCEEAGNRDEAIKLGLIDLPTTPAVADASPEASKAP